MYNEKSGEGLTNRGMLPKISATADRVGICREILAAMEFLRFNTTKVSRHNSNLWQCQRLGVRIK